MEQYVEPASGFKSSESDHICEVLVGHDREEYFYGDQGSEPVMLRTSDSISCWPMWVIR